MSKTLYIRIHKLLYMTKLVEKLWSNSSSVLVCLAELPAELRVIRIPPWVFCMCIEKDDSEFAGNNAIVQPSFLRL